MSLETAFNAILNKKRRPVTLKRLGTPDVIVDSFIAPSNYSRKLESVSDTIIRGQEFIITKQWVPASFWPLKRGDRIIDPDLGTLTMDELNPMYELGAVIIGFRIRCD